MKWIEVRDLDKQKVVVLPLGSLEQHGHHLPMLTDTIIVSAIAERVEQDLGESVLFLPTLWVGASDHHLAMPGTISLRNSTYIRVLREMLTCLINAGFRRIALLNGHGGNANPARECVYQISLENDHIKDLWVALLTYWDIAIEQMREVQGIQTSRITHACEYETSMILHLRAELVDMSRAKAQVAHFPSEYYVPEESARSKVYAVKPLHRICTTGALGQPNLATPEKGENLLEVISREVVRFLQDFATWPALEPG